MIRRAGQAVVRHSSWLLHYLIVAVVGLMVAISLGLGALALRLSHAPIDLTWIPALYGNSIQLTRGGVHLSFEQALLSWEGFQSGAGMPLDIRLTRVRVSDSQDRVLASAGTAFASISVSPLLLGRFVPRAIELTDGEITLVRDYQGAPDLGLSSELDAAGPEPAKPATPERRSFSEMLRSSDLLGQLDHVHLRNFRLLLRGVEAPAHWQAEIKDLALQRQPNGEISGSAHVPFVLDDRTADLELGVNLPRSGIGDVKARLGPVEAAAVAKIFPALAFLNVVQAPATTEVTLHLDHDLSLIGGTASVLLDPGTVRVGKSSLAISHGTVRVRATLKQVVIEEANLNVWGGKPNATTTVSLKGTIDRLGERIGATVTASVENLDVADLASFWPPDAGRNARAWVVQNVLSGSVPHATATLSIESGPDLKDVTLTKATAELEGFNVAMTWLDQVPPIERATVRLRLLDPDRLMIFMPSGRQRINGGADLQIRDGQMEITGLSVPDQDAKITLKADGPVTSALALLREPRLKLLSKHPIDLQEPAGMAAVNVSLAFPLETKLQAEQIVFKIGAHLEQVRVARLVAGRNLTDGVLDLTADPNGLTLKGTGTLAGIPLTADGFMDFAGGGPNQVLQRVNASARPTVAQLAAAGFPVSDVLASGDVPLTVAVAERRGGDGTVVLNADLGNAVVQWKAVGWNKPAGVPGKASATLVLVKDVLKAIQAITVESRDADLSATADLADGSIRGLTINRARLGRSDLRGSIHMPARGAMDVSLSGPAIDLSERLEARSESRGGKRNNDVPDLTLKLRFDRVFLAHGETASNMSLQATTMGSHLRSLDLNATLGTQGAVTARVGPSGGARRLTVDAADAGALLRGLDLTKSMRSGRLTIRGEYDDRVQTHPLTGVAEIDDARVENVPWLGKLLQAATLYGVADLLNGPGMGVSHIIVPFRYETEQLGINEARMYSSSLGLTAKGVVDMSAGRISLNGTVVPAYMLNSALGRIPFVGKIFSAEKGGGLFAARYTVDGPFGDASVSVNPLSMLTPGFLRNLFDTGSDKP